MIWRVKKSDGRNLLSAGRGGTTNSNRKLYWYRISGEVLAESDLSGTITAEFIYFGGSRIARRDLPSGNVYYYLADRLSPLGLCGRTDHSWRDKDHSCRERPSWLLHFHICCGVHPSRACPELVLSLSKGEVEGTVRERTIFRAQQTEGPLADARGSDYTQTLKMFYSIFTNGV